MRSRTSFTSSSSKPNSNAWVLSRPSAWYQRQVIRDPGRAPRIDLALQVLAVPGDAPVDSGNLSATLSADGRRLDGKIWLNGAQADWPALLLRVPR